LASIVFPIAERYADVTERTADIRTCGPARNRRTENRILGRGVAGLGAGTLPFPETFGLQNGSKENIYTAEGVESGIAFPLTSVISLSISMFSADLSEQLAGA
jgi:hypothetical protein